MKSGDYDRFVDAITDKVYSSGDAESGGKSKERMAGYPLPDEHWINARVKDEDEKTLLMTAISMGKHAFIHVSLSKSSYG